MKTENEIVISDESLTFSSLKDFDFFPTEYENELLSANVILIPEKRHNYTNPVFPEQTKKFYDYLVDNSNNDLKPNICINDDKYFELQLHSDYVNIATILVQFVVLPTVIGIVSNYIYDLLKSKHNDLIVKTKLLVEKDGVTKKFEYEGKAENFEKVIRSSVEKFFKDK